jgi:hypothetical protein
VVHPPRTARARNGPVAMIAKRNQVRIPY